MFKNLFKKKIGFISIELVIIAAIVLVSGFVAVGSLVEDGQVASNDAANKIDSVLDLAGGGSGGGSLPGGPTLGADGCELIDTIDGFERTVCNTYFWDGNTSGLTTAAAITSGGKVQSRMVKLSSNVLDFSSFVGTYTLVEVESLTTGEILYMKDFNIQKLSTGYTLGLFAPFYTGPAYGSAGSFGYAPSAGTWLHYDGLSTAPFSSGNKTFKVNAITIPGFDWTGKLN